MRILDKFPRRKLRDGAIYFFLFVGLLRIVNHFGPALPVLGSASRTLALSVKPVPFLTVHSWKDDASRGTWIECRNKNGTVTRTQWGPEFRARAGAPKRVMDFYTGVLDFFDSKNFPLVSQKIFPRLVCRESHFAKGALCGVGTEQVTVNYFGRGPDRPEYMRVFQWKCEASL